MERVKGNRLPYAPAGVCPRSASLCAFAPPAAFGGAAMIIGLTLGRYLSARFVKTVLAVFLTIVSLVYLVDFVEMLRRAGNIPEASTGISPASRCCAFPRSQSRSCPSRCCSVR